MATKNRVLIVDDEPLARLGVALRLKGHDDLEVIGEGSNGREAIALIRERKPDVVFLDIQMPGGNGFDVMRSLPPEERPFFILLTAYDRYFKQAFDAHAIDYLLKPIDDARFNASLDHARRVLGSRRQVTQDADVTNGLAEHAHQPRDFFRTLAVRAGKQVHLIATDDIDWIEANGDYTKLHVGKQSYSIRETLNTLAAKLDPRCFLRIHRSTIVRIDRIRSARSHPNRDCTVTLSDGTLLRASRTYNDDLRKLLRNRN